MMASAMIAQPAAAQVREGVSSLTHVVSVSVPARVKVAVNAVSMSSRSIPTAVRMTEQASANGLAVSIRANKAWVVSVSSQVASSSLRPAQWSGAQAAEFTVPVTPSDKAVTLTVSAP